MHELTQELKRQARSQGFDLVGVAAAGPAPGAEVLRQWLKSGFHGEMGYMERTAAVRANPAALLPGCRSVVVVAMSYHTSLPASTSPNPDRRVWVSRYAWGRDYHKVLRKRLIRVGRWLAAETGGCSWRVCVDTAPVQEREWAAVAGLGWLAKNTMLINRSQGSELFLGVLLCDVDLAPDGPTTAHCGRCTACLDACPTHAFPRPGVLDARRCVGYLTVEHHSDIPDQLHAGVGAMVAGCDICQEVCPWTKRAPVDLHHEFSPAPARFRPQPEALVLFDEDQYRQWRTGSALNRVSFAQFRRNLEVVRRNLGK